MQNLMIKNLLKLINPQRNSLENDPLIKPRYADYKKIIDKGGTFSKNKGKIISEISGLKFTISSTSDLLILKEVFIDLVYQFYLSKEKKCVVFDIGSNTGITSVFFSNLEYVSSIYSFEPSDETYYYLNENINQNFKAREKVSTYNYGLSNKTKKEIFLFDPLNKGSFGKIGNKKFKKNPKVYPKEVSLIKAEEAIGPLLNKVPLEYSVVMKIDCEGAEYEILPEILKLNRTPDLIMMEWHLSRRIELVEKLIESKYTVLADHAKPYAGMIYAFKN